MAQSIPGACDKAECCAQISVLICSLSVLFADGFSLHCVHCEQHYFCMLELYTYSMSSSWIRTPLTSMLTAVDWLLPSLLKINTWISYCCLIWRLHILTCWTFFSSKLCWSLQKPCACVASHQVQQSPLSSTTSQEALFLPLQNTIPRGCSLTVDLKLYWNNPVLPQKCWIKEFSQVIRCLMQRHLYCSPMQWRHKVWGFPGQKFNLQ